MTESKKQKYCFSVTVDGRNGVELDRFEMVYSILIEDTLKVLPEVKIVLMEPYHSRNLR